jgi:hypothetical protein
MIRTQDEMDGNVGETQSAMIMKLFICGENARLTRPAAHRAGRLLQQLGHAGPLRGAGRRRRPGGGAWARRLVRLLARRARNA